MRKSRSRSRRHTTATKLQVKILYISSVSSTVVVSLVSDVVTEILLYIYLYTGIEYIWNGHSLVRKPALNNSLSKISATRPYLFVSLDYDFQHSSYFSVPLSKIEIIDFWSLLLDLQNKTKGIPYDKSWNLAYVTTVYLKFENVYRIYLMKKLQRIFRWSSELMYFFLKRTRTVISLV